VFEGERNSNGDWLTIVDPSTNVSTGWEAAPEIGPSVWKKDVGLVPRELTIDNKRVAFVWSMEDMNTSINNVYTDTYGWTNCSELLNVSDDTLIEFIPTWGSYLIRFWDGLEALWGKSGNITYLRLRDGGSPNGMNIRVTPNPNWNSATFLIDGKSYLDFRNLKVQESSIGFYLTFSGAHHITIESNYLSGGNARVSLYNGPYQNIIRNNEMTDNPYGYNDPGAWGMLRVIFHQTIIM